MKYISYLLAVLLLNSSVHADPIIGQDYLAAEHKLFKEVPAAEFLAKGSATGALHNTFGPGVAHSDSIIAKVSPTYHRVHLINGPCIRNGNCGQYEIGYRYNVNTFNKAVENSNPKIINYVKASTALYKELAAKYPTTTFVVSPELEHNLSVKAWRVLADTIRSVWPGVQLANSPVGGIPVERYLGAWIERHGTTNIANADIVSTDGVHADLIDVNELMRRTKTSKILYWWTGAYNCRIATWQDPRDRKECPTMQMFEVMAHLQDQYGPPPAFTGTNCKTTVPFKDPSIWKVFAENGGNGDPRANKPVLITKAFGKHAVYILASNGERIGSLGYYSNYLDQGNRYYSGYRGGSGVGAYQFHKAAMAKTGNPYAWLIQGNKCQGPLLLHKRQGKMKG